MVHCLAKAGIIQEKVTAILGLMAILKGIVFLLNISAVAVPPARCPRRSGVWRGDALPRLIPNDPPTP